MASPLPLSATASAIFHHALAASSVEAAFARKLSTPEIGGIRHLAFAADSGTPQTLPLGHLRQVRIVAAGKASAEMLRSLLERPSLPLTCTLEGVLIAPHPPPNLPAGFQFFAGGHPLPNEASFAGARAALTLLQRPTASPDSHDTLCLFLISGGASAMMELPLDPSISLPDTIVFHQALVHSGASITEINCIRKHFSAVKGGRLALAAGTHPCLSLLVSDVPPAQLDALASGPTLPDPSTVAECHEILARYSLLSQLPTSVRTFFESPKPPETPKPEDLHAPAWTLLDSSDLANTAASEAERLGFHTIIDNTCDDWDYRDAAEYLLTRLRTLRLQHPRVCLLSSGEVTVQVTATPSGIPDPDDPSSAGAKPGNGGRNQHLALHLATLLQSTDGSVAILSAGSDGIDGNSKATGAVVDQRTLNPQNIQGAQEALARFDSSTFLADRGATIVTGPTGNNLRDLRILLAT